jgi:prephenate dehydrogenase
MKLTVIGLGLIGGSFARALRAAGAVSEVVACGRNPDALARAIELGVADRVTMDPVDAVRDADVVVLAVPLSAMRDLMARIAPALLAHAILTDVGSTKQSVIADAKAALGERIARFVPGHPIAGTERSGVEASFAELFQERRVILTPMEATDPAATQTIAELWHQAGATVTQMSAQHHDRVLALTSHLPHVLAFALVDRLSQMQEQDEIFAYAAGGFRDFTRIASSDPVVWRDICLNNRSAVLDALQVYRDELDELTQALRNHDGAALEALFARAKRARDDHYE